MTTTDDYLAGRAALAGRDAVILDLGCGDGRFVEMMLDAGLNAFGTDVPDAKPGVEARAASRPELRDRISYLSDPETINLPDRSVDIVVSNTVFEHIEKLEATISEIARILKPSGAVYTVFPLRTSIMEQHANLPFVHRIKSRSVRLRYIKVAQALGLYRGRVTPEDIEIYVSKHCFYRDDGEMRAMFSKHFALVECDAAGYIEARAKRAAGGWGRLLSAIAQTIASLVHVRHSAAYRLSKPLP